MVRIALAIEREVDDIRSIQDMGVKAKRKENQSSSSSRKKQKTYGSHGSQGHGVAIKAKARPGLLANQGR